MRFSLTSIVSTFLVLGAVVSAAPLATTPVDLENRATAGDPLAILTTLKTTTDGIFAKASSGTPNLLSSLGYLGQVSTAINKASTSMQTVPDTVTSTTLTNTILDLVDQILSNVLSITTQLGAIPLVGPLLGPLIVTVRSLLSRLLTQIVPILSGGSGLGSITGILASL